MTGTNANNWQQIVINWGISLETASHFSLRFNGHGGLVYPTLAGHRSRVLTLQPAADQPKNFWDTRTEHLPMPPLFNIPALALPESKLLVYITNGEKSTMALHSAGIPNAVNTFGEIIAIDRAIDVLREHRNPALYLAPDCDRTGLMAARKWQELTAEAGIKLDLRDLRPFLEKVYGLTPGQYKGYDLRDLWLLTGQHRERFQNALLALPPLDFDRYRDELPRRRSTSRKPYQPKKYQPGSPDSFDPKAAYTAWQAEVIAELDRQSPPPERGIHRHCPNPAHPDRHPSFRITEQGAPVCTCESSIPWDMLAGWLGMPTWEKYKHNLILQQRSEKIRRTIPHPEKLRHFPNGIPDQLREALLGLHRGGYVQDHAAALVVYEIWHEALRGGIWKPQQTVTVEMLVSHAARAARHTTEKTVRRGIMQLTALGFFIERESIRYGRGRPIQQYQAQTLHTALPIFIEHLCLRLRERIFKDRVLDTVDAGWFVGQSPDIAEILAREENVYRAEACAETQDEREQKEAAYHRDEQKLRFTFAFASLLTASTLELASDRTWEHGRAYRHAYYKIRAMQRYENGAAITRKRAAQQVGVSSKTLRLMQGREQIAVDPQFITLEVRETDGTMDRLDRAAPWAKHYHYGRFLESSSGQRITVSPGDSDDNLRNWIETQIETGHTVIAGVRIAGKERPATETETRAFQNQAGTASAQSTSGRTNLPPPEELSPPHLTLKYRITQLMIGGRNIAEAYRRLSISVTLADLIPDFPYRDTATHDSKGKKGNKSDLEPPDSDKPPD